ncbi:hypothetical protein [Microbulbifer sp. TYP-18]|uniref:hypothetical protein n=1 Tax=Microbulbifer sp. TYP-18 TaxID=3230024 RepID=UPI0034C67CB7
MQVRFTDVAGFLLVCVFILSSCRSSEIVFYEHDPSITFYESLNFSAENLLPFRENDVLFVVALKEVSREDYLVWLGLYTQSPGKAVVVHEAAISGDSWKKQGDISRKLVLDNKVENSDLMKTSVQLFDVRSDLLQKVLSSEADLTLDVSYSINDIPGVMHFKLVRRTEKHPVFST